MKSTKLIDEFQQSRRNKQRAVIEGVQALKHALRFGAKLDHIVSSNIPLLEKYLDELAPDIKVQALRAVEEVPEAVFQKLSPQPPRTEVIAVGERKKYQLAMVEEEKPIVFLEDPRDLENIGAVIRVSAAADVGAVIISGPVDIWHPAVIRGAAGLHFALPVLTLPLSKAAINRPIISLDPTGDEAWDNKPDKNSILVFGTERHGISKDTLEKSAHVLRLPMKQGVSSLNLATSVAATLYKM